MSILERDLLPNGKKFDYWEKECACTNELHVNPSHVAADDNNDGSAETPFKSIQAAANIAKAGTKVLIYPGTYRECVKPMFGGESPEKMVCYEATGNGEVVIKASELITDFEPSTDFRKHSFQNAFVPEGLMIWQHKLDPEMFKGYNPFNAINLIHDRLFIEYEKTDMTTYLNRRGMIFVDGKPLEQVSLYNQMSQIEGSYWIEANGQTIHFRLPGDANPSDHTIEITCREQCFAPDIPFLSYIKVKGLTCAHAATGAPVPQRGSISALRGHHWIIEDCTIDWSNTVGIDIGNECWHHELRENQILGHSIIRRCKILDAGVCGIAGLFAPKMLIEDNFIYGTGWQKMELSWEAGGIKLHHSIDGMFRRNIFKQTYRADHLWLDVGNENNRITENLFLDGIEQREAIFIECTKDEVNLIDNNIIWNVAGRFDEDKVPKEPGSTGWYKMGELDVINGYGIYCEGTDHLHIKNNLIGNCRSAGYFAKMVSFRMEGLARGGTSRDAHIIDNVFYNCGEAAIKFPTEHNTSEGNLFVKMMGGYLRIFYPAPQVNLDLKAWQKFYGFDLKGKEGWFTIDVDTNEYRMNVSESEKPRTFPGQFEKRGFVTKPDEVSENLKPFEKLLEMIRDTYK